MRFVFDGALQPMVTGKDLIMHTIGQIGVDGALYKAMEFTGEAIRNMPIDERFTVCNMAVEAGAKNGIIAPDEVTEQYLEGRARGPIPHLCSDADAAYEAESAGTRPPSSRWSRSRSCRPTSRPPAP